VSRKTYKSHKIFDSISTETCDTEKYRDILLNDCRIALIKIGPCLRHTSESDESAIKLLLSFRNKIQIELGKADILYIDQSGTFSDHEQRRRVSIALETVIAELEKI